MATERTTEEKQAFLERILSMQEDLRVRYEIAGEPDGCYYCGSPHHHSSDCREAAE